jgi:outer membrane protein assembly factor BamB
VTYADPNGWGRDKGVIIVQHTFPDGRTILSFYGHLDPPSVTVQIGQCLERGEKLGEIGDPRTPPHLHFEIRTHMPEETGTGYWFEDPVIAGWLPPSQTIWESRMAAWPGVLWIRSATNQSVRGIGIIDDNSYIVIEDDQFVAIDLRSGDRQWQVPGDDMIYETLADPPLRMLYTANLVGEIDAYVLPAETQVGSVTGGESSGVPSWSLDLEGLGFPTLMSLPGGGMLVARDGMLVAISAEGKVLWEAADIPRPDDWILSEKELVFSTIGGTNSLFTVDSIGLTPWQFERGGQLARWEDRLWLYGPEGVYKLDASTASVDLVYRLPRALYGWGDIVALKDGGAIVAHRDRQDRRLIAFEPNGDIRWQRSYQGSVEGTVEMILVGETVFLVAQDEVNRAVEVSLFAVNLEEATLTHLFTAGTRSPATSDTQVLPVGEDKLLINIGGGSMVLLDTKVALQAIEAEDREQ